MAVSTFGALDDHLASGRGIRAVKGVSLADVGPHVARRARERGLSAVLVETVPSSRFREVGVRLGAEALPGDPRSAAQVLVAAAAATRALVAVEVGRLRWDREVALALAGVSTEATWVLLDDGDPDATPVSLDDEAAARVLDSLVRATLPTVGEQEGGTLEERARRALQRTLGGLRVQPDAVARAVHARLAAVGRAWPLAKLNLLGASASSAHLLAAAGLVRIEGDHVVALGEAAEADGLAAEALVAAYPADAWALGRAAALSLSLRDEGRGIPWLRRAVELSGDAAAASDLWSLAELEAAEVSVPGCVALAKAASSLGDVEAAEVWAKRAAATDPSSADAWVALGLAQLGRGDLVTAHPSLSRALALGGDRPAALAGLAEVAYERGRHDEARSLAARVGEADRDAFLASRNTLGKLLLAEGRFDDAEAHFAEDATLAAVLGDSTAGLRARINRAVAILSAGRPDAAAPLLESVLDEGKRRGDPRVAAFALSNLSVIAAGKRRLGDALALAEQAVTARRRVGEKLGLARVIANLAEIRLTLGLVDDAAHALTFGRASASRAGSDARSAHFTIVSARIALARGDTFGARREVEAAVSLAHASTDGDRKSEAHRLAARIGLEDGDLGYAAAHLSRAAEGDPPPYAVAEIDVLRASLVRAEGEDAEAAATTAVESARRAGDPELLREALVLRASVLEAAHKPGPARRDAREAKALVEHVLGELPERLRPTFAAKPEIAATLRAHASDLPPAEAPRAPTSRAVARDGIVGQHRDIQALRDHIAKVGRSDATVLVLGESGTGKELVADALHAASSRDGGPLVKVNCGALVETLLLSELFGHEKGAFTGASGKKRGRFEVAEGGTLFLDEIGDISPATQVALLRVLQERTFERVGGTTPVRADVRIVCATHRDLRAMVEAGTFRQDLYFRLTQVVLRVPALRDRTSDLPALAASLLETLADERGESPKTLDRDALALLAAHRWPGNVRELDNVLRAAALFAEGDVITASDLRTHVEVFRREAPPAPRESAELPAPVDVAGLLYEDLRSGKVGLFDAKRNLERDCIARALAESGGNITRAAALLGMKRPRLSQLVKEYGFLLASEGSS